ncbi:hypothetical protein L3X38_036783 [Prunus dulcis]|uniref:O-fucosyltransferase family protein n=1 Tax=Prunus dulcis TaxID=3755 RepID=A0AAD4YPR7_PRUDU|nr:hypothetical protein L3X38_036783 [Prunus dulcis]
MYKEIGFLPWQRAADNFATADVKTYLLTAISGGLNQQRRGIIDAFIAAYILNATLLVLKLGQKLFWKDSSNFDEIFDVDWFISSLSKDVEIIKQLPTKGGIPMSPYSMHVLNKNIASNPDKIIMAKPACGPSKRDKPVGMDED